MRQNKTTPSTDLPTCGEKDSFSAISDRAFKSRLPGEAALDWTEVGMLVFFDNGVALPKAVTLEYGLLL